MIMTACQPGHLFEKRQYVFQAADLFRESGCRRSRRSASRFSAFVTSRERPLSIACPRQRRKLSRCSWPLPCDRAILADLVHRVRDDLADRRLQVCGNSGDLGDLRAVLYLLADLCQLGNDRFDGLSDAALKTGGVRPRGHVFQAFAKDRFGEYCGRCGAVAGYVAGLARDLANELCAHVLIGVFQLDFLGDGHAVFRNRWAAEFLIEDNIATRRPKSGLHGFREFLDAAKQGMPRGFVKREMFGCHNSFAYEFVVAELAKGSADDAGDVILAHDQVALALNFHFCAAVFGDEDLVPLFTVNSMIFRHHRASGSRATTSPS